MEPCHRPRRPQPAARGLDVPEPVPPAPVALAGALGADPDRSPAKLGRSGAQAASAAFSFGLAAAGTCGEAVDVLEELAPPPLAPPPPGPVRPEGSNRGPPGRRTPFSSRQFR